MSDVHELAKSRKPYSHHRRKAARGDSELNIAHQTRIVVSASPFANAGAKRSFYIEPDDSV
jgi:hypothetical protein